MVEESGIGPWRHHKVFPTFRTCFLFICFLSSVFIYQWIARIGYRCLDIQRYKLIQIDHEYASISPSESSLTKIDGKLLQKTKKKCILIFLANLGMPIERPVAAPPNKGMLAVRAKLYTRPLLQVQALVNSGCLTTVTFLCTRLTVMALT